MDRTQNFMMLTLQEDLNWRIISEIEKKKTKKETKARKKKGEED
jgi:hypothetical protein